MYRLDRLDSNGYLGTSTKCIAKKSVNPKLLLYYLSEII